MKKGFTLIELSIVLVIIGLIVGGVLVGRDLIETSKNRAVLSQLEKMSTGINTFRIKYNALPGDITNPTRFGLTNSTVANGDRRINDVSGNAPVLNAWGEAYYVFPHLSDAKLIEGSYSTYNMTFSYCEASPYTKQFVPLKTGGGGIIATSYLTGVYWYLGLNVCSLGTGSAGLGVLSTAGVLNPSQAYFIDSKTDDGKPGTGTVLAVTSSSGTLDTTDGNCVASSASQYNFSKSTNECRLYVRAQ